MIRVLFAVCVLLALSAPAPAVAQTTSGELLEVTYSAWEAYRVDYRVIYSNKDIFDDPAWDGGTIPVGPYHYNGSGQFVIDYSQTIYDIANPYSLDPVNPVFETAQCEPPTADIEEVDYVVGTGAYSTSYYPYIHFAVYDFGVPQQAATVRFVGAIYKNDVAVYAIDTDKHGYDCSNYGVWYSSGFAFNEASGFVRTSGVPNTAATPWMSNANGDVWTMRLYAYFYDECNVEVASFGVCPVGSEYTFCPPY